MRIQTRVLKIDPGLKLGRRLQLLQAGRRKKLSSIDREDLEVKSKENIRAEKEKLQSLAQREELSLRKLTEARRLTRSYAGRKKGADVEWARRTRLAKKIVQFLEGRGRAARNPALREWALGEIQRRRWKENVVREWAKGFFRGSLRERKYLRREEVAARIWERREARAEEDGLN